MAQKSVKKKLAIIGDPLYSSLSHLVRILKIFSLIKRPLQSDTFVFSYSEEILGDTAKSILNNAKKDELIDNVVVIPGSEFFDLNSASNLVTYTLARQHILEHDIKNKIQVINKLADDYENVIVLVSPGFLGNWYESPAVKKNVTSILILDTAFHPSSNVNLGTAWQRDTFRGKLQTVISNTLMYTPFLRVINRIRNRVGLQSKLSRQELYKDQWIIDPSVKEYSQLADSVDKHFTIGPLFPIESQQANIHLDKIRTFKGQGKLAYVTLGGSAKGDAYIKLFVSLVNTIAKYDPSVKFLVTSTDVFTHKDEVAHLLNPGNIEKCLFYRFLDTRIATKFADVTVGVLGKEQILMSAMNNVPVVVLPVNIDQATHANIVQELNIGIAPINNSLLSLTKSKKLIKNLFASVNAIPNEVMYALSNKRHFQNKKLSDALATWSNGKQRAQLLKIFELVLQK